MFLSISLAQSPLQLFLIFASSYYSLPFSWSQVFVLLTLKLAFIQVIWNFPSSPLGFCWHIYILFLSFLQLFRFLRYKSFVPKKLSVLWNKEKSKHLIKPWKLFLVVFLTQVLIWVVYWSAYIASTFNSHISSLTQLSYSWRLPGTFWAYSLAHPPRFASWSLLSHGFCDAALNSSC